MASAQTVLETSISELPLIHRGKVRDVYQVTDNELLMVATDRLSEKVSNRQVAAKSAL